MTEDFVSFELLCKLREKGYPCKQPRYEGHVYDVLKWLREEKKIFVEIVITPMGLYKPMIYDIGGVKKPYRDISPRINFNEAALEGIEYVIDNLI